jgi:DUF1680 family protein
MDYPIRAARSPAFECVPYYVWNNRGRSAMRVWLEQ